MRKVNLGQTLIELNKVQNLTSLVVCLGIFAVVIGCILLTKLTLWFFPIAFLVISGLQVHLSILLHDGAHHNMHSSKFWNETITDFFCAIPLTTYTKFYRALHLTHHRNTTSEENDPERSLFRNLGFNYQKMNKRDFNIMVFKNLIGIDTVKYIIWMNKFVMDLQKKGKLERITPREIILTILFWSLWIGIFYQLDALPLSLILWFAPLLTLSVTLIKLHALGEHYFTPSENEFERTYTHDYNPITNFFLYPLNSGLHLEHHLYPTVPWYRLKDLKKKLMEDSVYREGAERVTVTGYFFGEKSIYRDITH